MSQDKLNVREFVSVFVSDKFRTLTAYTPHMIHTLYRHKHGSA